jgi:AraC-like DNA-binding protein
MIYRVIPAPFDLSAWVECAWTLDGDVEADSVFPDGRMEMIFHYGRPFSGQPRAIVAGQITGPMRLEPSGGAGVLGIRLRPSGLAALSRVPCGELRNRVVEWRDLFGPSAELESRLMEPSDRAAMVWDWMRQRIRPGTGEVEWAIAEIERTGGSVEVGPLARRIGWSDRHLRRRFEDAAGMPPKLFARIVRFQGALRALSADGRGPACDRYFDEPHFARDFSAFTGMPPGEWLRRRNPMAAVFAGVE